MLTDTSAHAQVTRLVSEARALPEVLAVTDPYTTPGALNADGTIASITVQLGKSVADLDESVVTDYRELGRDEGEIRVVAGGELGEGGTEVGISAVEVVGVVMAGVVLAVTFGSLLVAGMTLVTALIGVGVGMVGLLLLTSVVQVSAVAPILALMLGLAVGIDYALFITSRHRGQLMASGEPATEDSVAASIAKAVATAGTAVVFAGGTVIIALVGLSLVGVPFLTAMGLAAALTVIVAVLIAITLVPAMLGFLGARILPKRLRGENADRTGDHGGAAERAVPPRADHGFGRRWAHFVTRWRGPVVILSVVLLGILAIPSTQLRLALPDNGTAPLGTPAREAFDLQAEGFGAGSNGPLVIVVDAPDAATATGLTTRVSEVITRLPDIRTVAPGPVNSDGTVSLVNVVPGSGPSSEETVQLVNDVRGAVAPLATDAGARVSVTGMTAIGVDVSTKLNSALYLYLVVVIGLSFLILLLAFRSILVPLKATLGFLLTIASTFGVTVAIFQWGWASELFGVDTPGPMISFLPIIMVGVLFGLAMDYQLFIVSRVHEARTGGAHNDHAVHEGMGHGARVVTAAALIMTFVFAGFIFAESPVIKVIGFGLALGVLIDAFVVRMTLVPAVLSLLGDRAWWLPRWLDRIVPKMDMEGHGTSRADDDETPRQRVLVSRDD